MHPAYSVIFFTTATGAGYGLLALFGLAAALGQLPADRGFAVAGTAVAAAGTGLPYGPKSKLNFAIVDGGRPSWTSINIAIKATLM